MPLPSWEIQELQTLGSQGQLSGVDPRILEGIDAEESGGNPGSPNSAGYGGFFGLSPSTPYPGGVVGSGEGQSTLDEFAHEATIAASAFASYMTEAGGSWVGAEQIYQSGHLGGSAPGVAVISDYLGANPPAGTPGTPGAGATLASANAQQAGLNFNPFDLFGIPQSAASAVWSSVGPFLAKAMLVVAGLGIIGIGLYKTTDAGGKARQAAQEVPPEAAAAAA
jgi:hypothetical protein